jgi:hypothetical protein
MLLWHALRLGLMTSLTLRLAAERDTMAKMMRSAVVLSAVIALGACDNTGAPTHYPDFCCTAGRCCGVRYYDIDGGVHLQRCSLADADPGGLVE